MDLKDDPRVAQGKKLLLEAVKAHQEKLREIKPADAALKVSYQEALDEFARCRGAALYYPYIGSGLGNGPLVQLRDGSVKYDCINGIGVHMLGHSHPKMIEAGIDAALRSTIMQGNLQQNIESLELMQLLTKLSGKEHCFLTTTGVMANENALKIAFQKKAPASRILAFEHCFAGRTWAFSQITDKPSGRVGLPLNVLCDYLPFFDPNHPEESTKAALHTLKTVLERYPKQHAMMIFEFVQGEGGIHMGAKSFFEAIMLELKSQGIPIIADEVQTFGRTPELFAFRFFGLEKYIDIITVGKLSQACATLFNSDFNPGSGLLSQTFISSTSMLLSSIAMIKELTDGSYFGPEGKIARLGNYFTKRMEEMEKRAPVIKGPYGVGTLLAFTPYGGDQKKTSDLAHRLFEAGVITFITGQHPTRIRLLPSVTTTEGDLDKVLTIIEKQL